MDRSTPCDVITGFTAPGKTALIRAWLGQRPPTQRWAIVLGDVASADLADLLSPSIGLLDLSGACACCAAAPVLRARLPGLLRRGPWDRLLIELSGRGLPQHLLSLLGQAPFDGALSLNEVIAVVEQARSEPFARLTDPDAPALARSLAVAQIESADRIWLRTDSAVRADPLPVSLAQWPPFGRPVVSSPVPPPPPRDMAPDLRGLPAPGVSIGRDDADELADQVDQAGPRPRTAARVLRLPDPARVGRSWTWPRQQQFDRSAVRALLAPTAGINWPAGLQLNAVLHTRRDSYRWQARHREGDGQLEVEETATAYRSDNRLDLTWLRNGNDDWYDNLEARFSGLFAR